MTERLTTESFLRPTRGGTLIRLRVSTGAKNTAVRGLYGESAEITRFLSGLLGIARADLENVSGTSSRDKTVLARGLGETEVRDRIGIVRT